MPNKPEAGVAREGSGRRAEVVRLFLSSPADVNEERRAAREVIGELAARPAYRRLKLDVVAWDDPGARIPMLANETPQQSVNNRLPPPSLCDIVIVILWSHMGTPLPDAIRKPDGERYVSGTEWEYFDALNSTREPRPSVLVYRRTEKPRVDLDDEDYPEKLAQYQRVKRFFDRFSNLDGSLAAGVNAYATTDEFRQLLQQNLDALLDRRRPLTECRDDNHPGVATVPPAYIQWLRRSLERVDLLGAREGRSVTLNSVYVPAVVTPPLAESGVDARPGDIASEQPERGLIPLLRRLNAESLYVSAPAGSGKSTFCRWAVLQSIAVTDLAHPIPASNDFAEPAPVDLRGRLPLLVPLRELWRKMDCGRGGKEWRRSDLEQVLAAWIDASPPEGLSGELFRAHLAAGSAFLLLDGLDEVPPSDCREQLTVYPRALFLSGLADALPTWQRLGNRILLTSRPYGLEDAWLHRLGLPIAPLEPLPPELCDLFVARWFHTLGKTEKTLELITTISERQDLAPLIENPMLLTAVCVLYDNGGRLPEDRYQLYKSLVEGVLHSRYQGDTREREPVERRLEAIALGMHLSCADQPRPVPVAEVGWQEIERLLGCFARFNPEYETHQAEVARRREDLLNHSGLLVPRANQRAAFYHLSFQEFLAAQRLSRTADDIEAAFRQHLPVPEWRPTLLFLFAAQIANRDAGWGLRLLARLIADQDRATVKANPASAVFIAEALELCLAKTYAIPEGLKGEFRRLALDAIEDEVALQARHALGLTLGRVGDPRIFDLRDPRSYVEVPAGRYAFGGGGQTVEIEAPFRIGHFPVTNQQFAAFIADGGYRSRHWWSAAGQAWLENAAVGEPAYWHARRCNAQNQPVVGVSFWEAEACCAWAGGRLPSEEEWEAAARGPAGLIYPWGNDWDEGRCNTIEEGLGCASPVGLFPRARRTDLAVDDLAGNVWEWSSSLYDPADTSRTADFRVLRGGAWGDSAIAARAIFRDRDHPGSRGNYLGFRAVRPSSPGHG